MIIRARRLAHRRQILKQRFNGFYAVGPDGADNPAGPAFELSRDIHARYGTIIGRQAARAQHCKTGNSYARQLLVEAARSHRFLHV